MKYIPLIILPLFLIPSALAVTVNENTYAIIHTDEGRFSEVVQVSNSTYILFDTSIYEYNITKQEFVKKLDIGLNYIGVDFTYNNGSFYIAGYQVKKHIVSGGGGGGGNIPVIICPIPTDETFDIYNFTIWQTNEHFGIEKTITLSKELYGGDYQTAINAMHVVFGESLIVAITGYNKDDLSTVESYVYEVDLNTGAFMQRLNFTERINDIAYYNGTYYINLGGTQINLYDSNFSFIKSFSDTVCGMHFIDMCFDKGKAYLVGNGEDPNGDIGGVFEVLTADLSTDIFYTFSNYTVQFNAVDHFGNRTYIVGSNNILYVFDDSTNHLITEYKNDMNQAYNLYDSQYQSVDSIPYPLKVIAFYNKTGAVKVIWGGYYIRDNFIYAYMISTDKPASWEPGGAGGFPWEPEVNDIWEKYKYYILLGGGLLLLLILSGGDKHE